MHLTATGTALICSHSSLDSQYNGNGNEGGGGGTDGLRRLVALAGDRMNHHHSSGNGNAGLQCEVLAVYRDRAANGDSDNSSLMRGVITDAPDGDELLEVEEEDERRFSTIEIIRIRRCHELSQL